MSESLGCYLPQDRLRALAQGVPLPEQTTGAVLFADLSGFTPLMEALSAALGPRRGAETLTHSLDAVYTALIAEVERFGGGVIGFAGDAITCWFDASDGAASLRAWRCAVAMQQAVADCAAAKFTHGLATDLALKVAVTSGPVRRLAVGDPTIQLIDTLVGATVARAAVGERLAFRGEVLADEATVQALGAPPVTEWRCDLVTGDCFAKLVDMPLPDDLPAPSPAVAPVPDALIRLWVNGTLYARERSGQRAFLAEFRPATTLFVRFAGIDYDSAAAGPRLDTFIRCAQGILANYGSMILQLVIGDKGSYFYAAFGAPIAHEDDAGRAVKAALALRSAARELEFLAPLQIGISSGTLWAGTYGGTLRRTYGVLGDEVNLAAGLMDKATPGEILISRRVQLLSRMTYIDQGAYAAAQPYLEEAAAIGRATGDRCGLARALGACGDAAWYQGDNSAAQVAYADSLALYRETGEKRFWQLINLGLVEVAQGNLAKARVHHEESLALAREMGYKQGVAWSLLNIASDTLVDQDFAKARGIAEESLALSRALGDLRGCIWAMLHLAATVYETGDMGGAQTLFIECLQLSGEMRQMTLLGIIGAAAVAVGVGDHGRAARLAGAVEALRIAIWVGPFPHPYVGQVHSRTVAAVWAALGASQFAAAWAEGQTLSLEAAVALAMTPLSAAQA